MLRILFTALLSVFLLALDAQIKQDSLLAFYPLNGNAGDSSGSGAHATAFNMLDTTDRFGDVNKAYYFNGTSSYLLLPNDSGLKPAFPFSVSLWLYLDEYPTLHRKLYSSDDVNNYSGFWMTLDPQGKIAAGYGNNLGISTSNRRTRHTNTALSKDQWIHVVASFNGLNATDIYVNGVVQAGFYSGSASAVAYSNSTGSIGRYITSSGTRYIEALMDDIRIYNDTLDQTDVNFLQYEVPCTGVIYDSVSVFDTVTYNLTVFDTVAVYDSIAVTKQVTQFDTIAVANTLVINSTLSLEENASDLLQIYPNPTQGAIQISSNIASVDLIGKHVVITNVQGQTVYEAVIAEKETRIEVHELISSGTLFVSLVNEMGVTVVTKKIIVY